jgi:putative transposase
MEKTARNKDARQEGWTLKQMVLPMLETLAAARVTLLDLVFQVGLTGVMQLLEQEREALCGARYKHDRGRKASRAGTTPGELALGGRRVTVKRPRVRSKDGTEIPLKTWEALTSEDPLTERALEQVLVGVSMRKYGRSLEPLPPQIESRGTSKSAVSRRFIEATTDALAALMNRNIAELDIRALMLDGIVVGAHTILVALGIDGKGEKHVLGLCEGATENAEVCKSLLTNLVDRGLPTDRSLLAVIDGSKALAKALRDVFGKRVLVQRCQVHKKRNVLEHLPERERQSIGNAISFAYRCRNAEQAKQLLTNLARKLEKKHPGAAASLREGLDETLTVLRFGLPDALEKTLCTTNAIENMNATIRRVSHNVKRWNDGTMVLRWLAAALGEAEKGFRRLKGYHGIPKLIEALQANDAKLNEGLAPVKKAA